MEGFTISWWDLWPRVVLLTVLAALIPVFLARFFGKRRSWGPVKATAWFLLTYLLVMGLSSIGLSLFEGWFGWESIAVFFWPAVVLFGLPLFAIAILAGHVWASRAPAKVYSLSLAAELALLALALVFKWDPAYGEEVHWMVAQLSAGAGVVLFARRTQTGARPTG